MKNSTLLLRSLIIVAILTGLAHLFSNVTSKDSLEEISTSLANKPGTTKQELYGKQQTDFLIGKWAAAYSNKELNNAIIYDIRKEGKRYNAYTYQYKDTEGNVEPAEGTKLLIITSFTGDTGKGLYPLEYEGESYDVECTIKKVNKNTFKLNYNYYNYSGVETWKRQ